MYFCPFGWTFPPVNGRPSSSSSGSSKHFATDALQHSPSCMWRSHHPAFVCVVGLVFFVVVGGCEGLFLCLFFSWPYRCVPHCVGQCPTVTTFLLKVYFSSTSALCLWNICELPIRFFFFFFKSVMWFLGVFLAPGETSELQLSRESQDEFVFCDILEEPRYQDESLVWKGTTTAVISTFCRRQLTLVTDKSASKLEPGCLCLCWVGLFAESSWLPDPCGSHAGLAGSQAERQGDVCQHSCSLRGSVIDTMWATDLLHQQLPLFCCCGQK